MDRRSVFLVISLTLISSLVFLTVPQVSANPQITINPTSGPPGSTILVTGTGFAPNQAVDVACCEGPSGFPTIGTTTTNGNGGFSSTFTLPPSGLSGTTTTVLVSDASNNVATATFKFNTDQITLKPISGPVAGTQVTVTGTGFAPTTGITVQFGTTQVGAATADDKGGFSLTFTVPALASPGANTVTATEGNSNSATATFTVTTPQITLSRTSGLRGTGVAVTGTGFAANTGVIVNFAGNEVSLGGNLIDTFTDGNGGFKLLFSVPASASPGANPITAIDFYNNQAMATFTVTAPQITLSPTSGPDFTIVKITGTGFGPFSPLTVGIDGFPTFVLLNGFGGTDGNGAFQININAASLAQGDQTVTATDQNGNQATATFTVTPQITPEKITLNPASGTRANLFTITGTGFVANTLLTNFFNEGRQSDFRTDGNGNFVGTSIPSPSAFLGPNAVTVFDANGNIITTTFTLTSPQIALSSTSGSTGTQVTVTGTGFDTTSNPSLVRIAFTGDGQSFEGNLVATTTIDGNGGFQTTITVPASALLGVDTVIAKDRSGNQATAPFTVPSSPQITLNPTSGPSGTQVTVTGTGFNAYYGITIDFGGYQLISSNTATAPVTDGNGAFQATINALNVSPGDYTVTATDGLVNPATARFTIGCPITPQTAVKSVNSNVPAINAGCLQTTTTTITPNPATAGVGKDINLVAKVAPTSANAKTPIGLITWTDGGAGGTFTNPLSGDNTCELSFSTSSCGIPYTVSKTKIGGDKITITASYSGDTGNEPSHGTTTLTVLDETVTTMAAVPGSTFTGGITLNVIVRDDTVPTNTPTGDVKWDDGKAGGTFTSDKCALIFKDPGEAFCVGPLYHPPKGKPLTITATYSGDGTHDISVGTSTPDFVLHDQEAVQAPFGEDKLVAGKPTVFKVPISTDFPEEQITVKLDYDTLQDGNKLHVTRYEACPLDQLSQTFFLPSDPSCKLLPGQTLPTDTTIIPDGGVSTPFSATVEINPHDSFNSNFIPETDSSNDKNNLGTINLPVKVTKQLRILFQPIHQSDDPSPAPSCDAAIGVDQGSLNYMLGTYPIDPKKFQPRFTCQTLELPSPDFDGQLDKTKFKELYQFLDILYTFNNIGFDKYLGIVRQNWFHDNTYLGGANGASFLFLNSAIIEQDATGGHTAAHEIAHTFGWVKRGDPAECTDMIYGKGARSHTCHLQADGYWVAERKQMHELDFMDAGGAPAQEIKNWISIPTFDYLLKKLKQNPLDPDPDVIGVSGIIFKDDTTILEPWYRFSGAADIPLGNPGNYAITYLDKNSNVIGQTGFDVSFHGPHMSDTDVGGFVLKIPDLPGTSKFLIKHGSKILATRTVSANPPTIKITNPLGGQIFGQGQSIRITWDAKDLDNDPLSYLVYYSPDAGQNWIPLSFSLKDNRFSFVITPPVSSSSTMVRVIASDGINTADVKSGAFTTLLSTMQQYKGSTSDDITALKSGITDSSILKKIDRATLHVQESVSNKLWNLDGNTLNDKLGDQVFDKEASAVNTLEKLIGAPTSDENDVHNSGDITNGNTNDNTNDGDLENSKTPTLPPSFASAVNTIVGKLVGIDESLAQGEIDAATAHIADLKSHIGPDDTIKKVQKDIDKANEFMQKGQSDTISGKVHKAIHDYREAWAQADEAINITPENEGHDSGNSDNHK